MSFVAAMAAASARFSVASRRDMTRRAAGVSRPSRPRASTTGWLTARKAAPAGSPKIRASLYACVNRKSPPCVRQRGGSGSAYLARFVNRLKPLRHASQLAVLLPLRVEQELLHDGGDRRSERCIAGSLTADLRASDWPTERSTERRASRARRMMTSFRKNGRYG